jgi:acyl carrier protein
MENNTDTRKQILKIIENLTFDDVTEDFEVYFDYLDTIEIIMEIEREFDCRIIDEPELESFKNIGEFITWVINNSESI